MLDSDAAGSRADESRKEGTEGFVVTKEFEQLCEKEFALKQDEAYKGFDRELANLREHYAHHGLLVSSSRAQAVMDAALLRFDKILDGFESIYLAKSSDPARLTDEEDVTWLKKTVGEKMEPAIFELRTKVQSDLWEQSCALTGYWQKVESEARKRSQKIREKIEIIQTAKKRMGHATHARKCKISFAAKIFRAVASTHREYGEGIVRRGDRPQWTATL
jgi:hypothetical protein